MCSPFGSVSGPFTTPGLTVSLVGRKKKEKGKKRNKPPSDFKPIKQVLLVFLDATGRGGLLFTFLPSYGFARMGARPGLQYSQLPSLQPRSSVSCRAPTVHLCQACALNLPVVLRSVQCTSFLLLASPICPEPTSRQVAPVSCWVCGATQPLEEQHESSTCKLFISATQCLGRQCESSLGAGLESAWQ